MTYLSGKANKRKQLLRRLALAGIFFLIVIFWATFKKNFYPLLEPIVIQYGAVKDIGEGVPDFFKVYIASRKSLLEKDKALEITVQNLENELAEKNAKLKELTFIKDEQVDSMSSSVLVMYPLMTDVTRLYSTILLSKGFKDGVEKDAYIYVRGMQPVCIIKEVYTSTSLCELISASGIKTDVIIEGSSSSTIAITLTGRGGGVFLGDIARDTPINKGDSVYLKSNPAMLLGTVVDVLNNNQDTSWRIFVNGAYNPVTSSIFYMRKNK